MPDRTRVLSPRKLTPCIPHQALNESYTSGRGAKDKEMFWPLLARADTEEELKNHECNVCLKWGAKGGGFRPWLGDVRV